MGRIRIRYCKGIIILINNLVTQGQMWWPSSQLDLTEPGTSSLLQKAFPTTPAYHPILPASLTHCHFLQEALTPWILLDSAAKSKSRLDSKLQESLPSGDSGHLHQQLPSRPLGFLTYYPSLVPILESGLHEKM